MKLRGSVWIPDSIDCVPTIDILHEGPSRENAVNSYLREELMEVTRPRRASYLLIPHGLGFLENPRGWELLDSWVSKAPQAKVIAFNMGDYPVIPKVKIACEFRSHSVRNTRPDSFTVIPPNIRPLKVKDPDHDTYLGIQFCGYIPKLVSRRISHAVSVRHPSWNISMNPSFVRRLAIRQLRQSGLPNFIKTRNQFAFNSDISAEVRKRNRAEYENYFSRYFYALCPRGDGNYSLRFYEALSAGRIPLVPNTGVSYPLSSEPMIKSLILEHPILQDISGNFLRQRVENVTKDEAIKRSRKLKNIFWDSFYYPKMIRKQLAPILK